MLTPEPRELPRHPHRTTPVRDDPFSTYAIGVYNSATDTLVVVAGTLRHDSAIPDEQHIPDEPDIPIPDEQYLPIGLDD